MGAALAKFLVLSALLVGMPLLGVRLAGLPVARYLSFPPATGFVPHAPFSGTAFAVYGVLTAAAAAPFLVRAFRHRGRPRAPLPPHPVPWWGWAGVLLGAVSWLLAWTRFPRFAPLQDHTFTPLWVSYILAVNGLAVRKTGGCLMLARPGYFLALFPASSAFWWFFEYLNRFVQNWHYPGAEEYTAAGYVLAASIPFSTVLPAVLSTKDLLEHSGRIAEPFRAFFPVRLPGETAVAAAVLLGSCAALAGIGLWPERLYSLVWVAPLLVLSSLQALTGGKTIFAPVREGDWSSPVCAALAALVCGFFWEMWNFHSQAKWVYSIPYVQRFPLFEMPALGYAGYLPFGLQCAAAAALLEEAIFGPARPDRIR